MARAEEANGKVKRLRDERTLNPRPQEVRDELFQKEEFFDPHDLLQVRYEMLRRVQEDGQSVTQVSADFGFSRPSFYQARSAFEREGLIGLIRRKPGPREAHKLTEEVMQYIEQAMEEDKSLRPQALAPLVKKCFGLSVHPVSIARALSRKEKKGSRRVMSR